MEAALKLKFVTIKARRKLSFIVSKSENSLSILGRKIVCMTGNTNICNLSVLKSVQPKAFTVKFATLYLGKEYKLDVTLWFISMWAKNKFKTFCIENLIDALGNVLRNSLIKNTESEQFRMYFNNLSDHVLEVHYELRESEKYRILYKDRCIYPPYSYQSLPKFRYFARDIYEAHLIQGIEMDEYLQVDALCEEEEDPNLKEDSSLENTIENQDTDEIQNTDETQDVGQTGIENESEVVVIYEEQQQESTMSQVVTEEILSLRGPGVLFYDDTDVSISKTLIKRWVQLYTGNHECMLGLTWTNGDYEVL